MEYLDIIEDITSNLTGDSRKDFDYLQSEADKYKDHEYSLEIVRSISRLLCKVMPDDMNDEIDKMFSNMQLSTDTVVAEVQLKIREGDLDQAERMIKTALFPESMFKEDKVSIFFAFNNPIEEIYYKSKFKPVKDIRIVPQIDADVFLSYAYILIEKKRFDEAMAILDRGLRYNPLETKLLFEKGEIFKLRKEWDDFKHITDLCMEYSYSSKNIARAYRNYGYMFVELEDYDVAICCYLMCLARDRSDMAQSQLYYISQLTDRKIKPEDYSDKIEELFNDKEIRLRANPELLQIAYGLGKQFEDDQQLNDAHFFYSIVYDLTNNEEIKEKLMTIKNRAK